MMKEQSVRKAFILLVLGCAYILSGCGGGANDTPPQVSLTVLPLDSLGTPQSNAVLELKGGGLDLTCFQVGTQNTDARCSTGSQTSIGNSLFVIPIIFNSVPTGQYTLSQVSPTPTSSPSQCQITIVNAATVTSQNNPPCAASGNLTITTSIS
jgi:hypothetical protein